MIQLNSNKPLYELATQYPQIIDLMATLGFKEIEIPGMLQTAGRRVTIPQGAKMKHISWDLIVSSFADAGFELIGGEDA